MIVSETAPDLLRKHLALAGVTNARLVGLEGLRRAVNLRRPKAILALGVPATEALLGKEFPMKELVGKVSFTASQGYPVVPCYHPKFVERNAMREYDFQNAIEAWQTIREMP